MQVQLDIPKDRAEEIKALMKEVGISTQKEFFNSALSLLEWAIREKQTGRIVGSLNLDEETSTFREIVSPALDAIQPISKPPLEFRPEKISGSS